MKALPAGSKATSVTCLKRPSSAASGGFGCFSGEVQVLRQLERVRSIERNLRHRLLRERGRCEQHEQSDKRAFHDILLLRGFLDAVRRRLRHESIAADER